jgi:hypothetical protein
MVSIILCEYWMFWIEKKVSIPHAVEIKCDSLVYENEIESMVSGSVEVESD